MERMFWNQTWKVSNKQSLAWKRWPEKKKIYSFEQQNWYLYFAPSGLYIFIYMVSERFMFQPILNLGHWQRYSLCYAVYLFGKYIFKRVCKLCHPIQIFKNKKELHKLDKIPNGRKDKLHQLSIYYNLVKIISSF